MRHPQMQVVLGYGHKKRICKLIANPFLSTIKLFTKKLLFICLYYTAGTAGKSTSTPVTLCKMLVVVMIPTATTRSIRFSSL